MVERAVEEPDRVPDQSPALADAHADGIEPVAPGSGAADQPILFLHIPKTAGTSFFTTLQNVFGEAQVLPLAEETPELATRIAAVADGEGGQVACIYGHLPVHRFAGRLGQFRPFTILRHPIARVFSLFRFQRLNPNIEQFGLRRNFSFEEFLAAEASPIRSQVSNGMCRVLAGDASFSDPARSAYSEIDRHPEVIGQALDLLKRIDFGLAEDMPGTHRIIQHRWSIPFALDEMVLNTTDRDGADADWRHVHAVVERNRLDIALYERAAAIFRDRLTHLSSAPRAPASSAVHMVFRPVIGQWSRLPQVPGRQGFHGWEASGIAWINEGPTARMHFLAPAPSARIALRVFGIGESYPFDRVELRLGDRPLPFRISEVVGPWCTLESRLIGLPEGINTLSIVSPVFIPVRDIDPGSVDRRKLGIAVAAIAFLD